MMVLPYTIDISDDRLAAIKAKVKAYDWSQLPDAGGWTSGVGVNDLKRLVAYWQDAYDWRKVEHRLNQLPNFATEVEGERIHFVHVRGHGSKPPLLLLHGWPGSFLEFERLLDPLATDGHDVIVPSLPGFAFSKPITGIIGPRRAAELMHALMVQLFGQLRYIVQGGDWGSSIASWIAYNEPDALLGFHINMVNILAEDATPTTPEEKAFISRRAVIFDWELGYNLEQETRPQTLGVAMADSPVGAAGWILEKFGKWADLPTNADGSPDIWSKFSEEQLLTNIMLSVGAVLLRPGFIRTRPPRRADGSQTQAPLRILGARGVAVVHRLPTAAALAYGPRTSRPGRVAATQTLCRREAARGRSPAISDGLLWMSSW
jgi:pimeloyl-ACP methyl ester carboxylesterase